MSGITEDDIADYLIHTPGFFERHASLLAAVQLTSAHGKRAVGLQERQAEMLRDKIKHLELRMMDMIRYGGENQQTSSKMHRWTCEILRCKDTAKLPYEITEQLEEIFSIPQVALRIWGVQTPYLNLPQAEEVSTELRVFTSSLKVPHVGVNTDFEASQWLRDPQAAASIAMMPLRHPDVAHIGAPGQAFGLLVCASPDPQRFHATMGTEFLEQIADIASSSLVRLC